MRALNDLGQQYHLELRTGDVGRYVILPGDPGRVPSIAAFLEDAHPVAQHREYVTWTGKLNGVPVSVCSTGIGAPSTAIAVEELIAVGADTFIRVGTAGMIQEDIPIDGVVIATGSVRDEGTTRQYIPLSYPAVADPAVVIALHQAADKLNMKARTGIVQSKDSFYGETEPDTMPLQTMLDLNWTAWKRGNVLASEMESSALFVISSIRGVRSGCLLNNRGDMSRTIKVAVEAIRILISNDHKNESY